jgi:repressor LexA
VSSLTALTFDSIVVKIHDAMARRKTAVPTQTHLRILRAVAHLNADGKPAPVSELVEELGLAGETSLTRTLEIIRRNGFIEIHGGGERGKRRIVTLTKRGVLATGLGGLPVLGSIPAGPLSEFFDQCEEIVADRELLPYQAGDFLLVVKGDSMTGDGILFGDKVLIRPGMQPRNGEIAAVQVGDDYQVTLKRVWFGPGRGKITLKASNPAYENQIIPAKRLRVAGVYRGLVRHV